MQKQSPRVVPRKRCSENIQQTYKRTSMPKRNFNKVRDGSRTAAASKMERFVIIVNGFQSLTIITKRSILDVAAALDPPLKVACNFIAITLRRGCSPVNLLHIFRAPFLKNTSRRLLLKSLSDYVHSQYQIKNELKKVFFY